MIEKLSQHVVVKLNRTGETPVPCHGDGPLVVALVPPDIDGEGLHDQLSVTHRASGCSVLTMVRFPSNDLGLRRAIAARDALLGLPLDWTEPAPDPDIAGCRGELNRITYDAGAWVSQYWETVLGRGPQV